MEMMTDTKERIRSAYELYKLMYERRLILAYEGDVSQDLTKAFSALAEENLNKEHEDDRVKRQVFHVIIESLQNLSKHSYDHITGDPAKPGTGLLLLARLDDSYVLTTGNAIRKENVDDMKHFLDKINDMDELELKEFYKKQLKENRLSEKGGAGLGFIDMAKKTRSKIAYDFVQINDTVEFFIYQVHIKREVNQ